MKTIKVISFLLINVVFLTCFSTAAYGYGYYSTEELSDERMQTCLDSTKITPLTEEPQKRGICSFDANENGQILIGCEIYHGGIVCIYSDDGSFQRGYSFETLGSFEVAFFGENIAVLLVRSGLAVLIDPEGNVVGVYKYTETRDDNQFWFSPKTVVKTSNAEYRIKNDMGFLFNLFSSSYSQIAVKDKSGTERIIYDVNGKQLAHAWIVFALIMTLIGSVTVFLVFWFVVSKKVKRSIPPEDRKKARFFLGD